MWNELRGLEKKKHVYIFETVENIDKISREMRQWDLTWVAEIKERKATNGCNESS